MARAQEQFRHLCMEIRWASFRIHGNFANGIFSFCISTSTVDIAGLPLHPGSTGPMGDARSEPDGQIDIAGHPADETSGHKKKDGNSDMEPPSLCWC